jgi:hypothetical protein
MTYTVLDPDPKTPSKTRLLSDSSSQSLGNGEKTILRILYSDPILPAQWTNSAHWNPRYERWVMWELLAMTTGEA